jgi:hypothetical protein
METRNITLTPIITKQACKEPCEFVRNLMDYGKYPIWCMKCDKSWPRDEQSRQTNGETSPGRRKVENPGKSTR